MKNSGRPTPEPPSMGGLSIVGSGGSRLPKLRRKQAPGLALAAHGHLVRACRKPAHVDGRLDRRHVIVWAADDQFSLSLMREFYGALAAGADVGESLRRAKLRMLELFGSDVACPCPPTPCARDTTISCCGPRRNSGARRVRRSRRCSQPCESRAAADLDIVQKMWTCPSGHKTSSIVRRRRRQFMRPVPRVRRMQRFG